MSSGPINYCLTDEFSELEETGSTTFVEILSKIEERTFREGLEIVENVRTHYRLLTDSPKRENQSQESDLALRSSTRRGRLSAFQSLLGHDKWCWMRSVKRREIRNMELPTEAEQLVCKINLWPREIECRGFVAAQTSMLLEVTSPVDTEEIGCRETAHLQSGCWIMRTVHICTTPSLFSMRLTRTHLWCTALWPLDCSDVTTWQFHRLWNSQLRPPLLSATIALSNESFINESLPWLVKLQCCHSYTVFNDNLIPVQLTVDRCKLFWFCHIYRITLKTVSAVIFSPWYKQEIYKNNQMHSAKNAHKGARKQLCQSTCYCNKTCRTWWITAADFGGCSETELI